MWPFKKTTIQLTSYPKEEYSSYWEIHISPTFAWTANIYDYETGRRINTFVGKEKTREKAQAAAIKEVKKVMKNYKRNV